MISSLSGFLCHLAGTGPGDGQAGVSVGAGARAQRVQQALTDQRRLRRARRYRKSPSVTKEEAERQRQDTWLFLLCSVTWWLRDQGLVTRISRALLYPPAK